MLNIKMNKMLLKLISLFLLMQFMESECQNDTYDLSAQYEEFAKQGALKQLFKAQIRNQEIMGFICACALIREANNQEYKKARQIFADYMCATTWKLYFEHLRKVESGKSYFLEFLQPKEHDASCALALCASFDVCSKHIRCDSNTVQILTQLRIGTTKSIEEMLQKESPRYLLSVEDMNLINGFLKAVGQAPFRFIKLIKFGKEYAIPKVRNYTDRVLMAAVNKAGGQLKRLSQGNNQIMKQKDNIIEENNERMKQLNKELEEMKKELSEKGKR